MLHFLRTLLWYLCIVFQESAYYNINGSFLAIVCAKFLIAFLPFGSDKKYGGIEMSKKYCYLFTEGNANMRELLGGKGANLAEMTNIGLPVL